MLHRAFLGRTVAVAKKAPETMLNTLNAALKQNGILTRLKINRRFEKPTKERVRKEVRALVPALPMLPAAEAQRSVSSPPPGGGGVVL